MTEITAGERAYLAATVPVPAAVSGLIPLDDESRVDTDRTYAALLADALKDALTARDAGLLGGPSLDRLALRRAEHVADDVDARARRIGRVGREVAA